MKIKKHYISFWKEEENKIQHIKSSNQYVLFLNKWKNIRAIINEIYIIIPPFKNKKSLEEKHIIPIGNKIGVEKILSVNINNLTESQKLFLDDTFKQLLDLDIIDYHNWEDRGIISTSKPYREFLKGKIIIKNRDGLEKYHKEVSELCDSIEKNGKKKFPELYGKNDTKKVTNEGIEKTTCHKLPADTKWDEVEIKFKNEFDIEIFVKQKFLKKYSNIDLKFYSGTKENKPDRQWQFLILLSTLQGKYEKNATKDDMALSLTNEIGKKITINNCEKIAKNLSEKLSYIFGIDNPLFSYKERGYYKPKFKLTPVPIIRGGGEVHILPRNEFKDSFDYGNKEEPDEDGFISS